MDSCLGHAVGYDQVTPPTSYSYQVFSVHIQIVSAPSVVAGGHKDATSLISAGSHSHSDGSRSSLGFSLGSC